MTRTKVQLDNPGAWAAMGCKTPSAAFEVLELKVDRAFGSGIAAKVSPALQPDYPLDNPENVWYDWAHFKAMQ